MDSHTIFVRTPKGEDEMRNKSAHLVGDIKRALLMVDGAATFGEISKRAAPSLRSVLDEMFVELERGGFIQDKLAKDKPRFSGAPRMATPLKMATPHKMAAQPVKRADEGVEELDFTSMFRAPSAEMMAAEAEKLKVVAEAQAHALAEVKAKQQAETARIRGEAEEKARKEIEAAKLKAQREADEARLKAERDAVKAREEAELVKRKALFEAKAREEAERRAKEAAEAARAKAEQEAARVRAELEAAKVKAEAEAQVRKEIEAAKIKAQREAEEARLKAEREAAQAREEAELAKQKALAEAKAREEAEQRARAEAEAARVRAELEAAKAKAEAEAQAREEAERRLREEAEAAQLKAQQEAEAARLKAEEEAAKAREDAEQRARAEAEAARVKAEQEAARVRAELEAAKAKAEVEAQAREEAERRLREEAEAAQLKAQQAAEAAHLKAEEEAAKAREEAEQRARAEAEAARVKAEREAAQAPEDAEAMLLKSAEGATKAKHGAVSTARSTSVTVLFFDVVGYTKQTVNKQIEIKKQFNQLVTDCLATRGDDERIILDTGDGAAIGFLQHPEDALEVAMQFRKTVMAYQHGNYPDLKVRIGIHLGPVNVVKDMNGQSNMVGDGINDAQRVMSFAGIDQIYISRPYYDFVSRLSDEYAGLFQYRGLQKDKHGREHPVYELMDAAAPVAQAVFAQADESAVEVKLEPFSFALPEAAISPAPIMAQEKTEPQQPEVAAPAGGLAQFKLTEETEETKKPVEAEQVLQQQTPPPVSAPPMPPVKEAAKPTAEARMPSAEEVAKLAETQAKAWAEAEQRAAEATRTSAERAGQPREAQSPAKETVRVRRKPVPWGKIGAGLFVALLVALFVVPPLMPTQGYATRVEQLLAARLQQPVHVGQLSGRLLPTPRLELKSVSIGEAKPIQAQRAQIDFALSALFSSNMPITGVELEGVQVNGAALPQISAWLQQIAATPQYPVALIGLSQGKLEADGMLLSGIGGELSFDQAGKFMQAKLRAEGNKFALDINASPENKTQVSIAVRGSALPSLPNWVFDQLDAKGELTGDGLVITELDGRIMGGILKGDARIDWSSGWRAQGALTAKTITMQNMSKALNGDMDGTASFQMQAPSLAKLVETASLEGDFVIGKGVINSIDVVETARMRSTENLPGGRTHFDELSGKLSYANGDYHFRQVKMSTGVLNATATLDIAKQQVSGRVIADLTMRAGMDSIVLQVGGTPDNPSLRAIR